MHLRESSVTRLAVTHSAFNSIVCSCLEFSNHSLILATRASADIQSFHGVLDEKADGNNVAN
jgi:hypothetical protein